MTDEMGLSDVELKVRMPRLRDAAQIHRLVTTSGVLDANSSYLYLLLCRDFRDTCLVLESDSDVCGFVTAYRPPTRPDVIFVWQIAVAESLRRRGQGLRLLNELISCPAAASATFLEATVSPSNTASRRLFRNFAESLGAELQESEGFRAEHFPGDGHDAEPVLRIGPLPVRTPELTPAN